MHALALRHIQGALGSTRDSCDWAPDGPEYKVTAVQVMPVAQPSSWQRAYKDFNEDQERFLADARLGAAVTVAGK